jgi:hypothetical protein
MQDATYLNIDTGDRETVFFFMLNAYLLSRIDTEHESSEDEEVNVYMAGLLQSLVDGSFHAGHGEWLGTTPTDVFSKVEEGDTNRHRLEVYRSNADYRMIAFGLFSRFGDCHSDRRSLTASGDANLEEAQQYYGWASVFSSRMPERYHGLSVTLEKLAENFDTYVDVLSYMGANYMNFIKRFSAGQMYHLGREAHEAAVPRIHEHILDHMLDAYNQWKAEPTMDNRRLLTAASTQYMQVDPEFNPDVFTA